MINIVPKLNKQFDFKIKTPIKVGISKVKEKTIRRISKTKTRLEEAIEMIEEKINTEHDEKSEVKIVLDIFESEYSEEVYDRKAREVLKYLDKRKDGFFFYELADITKIAVRILKLRCPLFCWEFTGLDRGWIACPFLDGIRLDLWLILL